MDADVVTLVVKAPNQQITDQNIRCSTQWSVKKLKQHLSEVYPSKPKPQEQKIIYSGQLLEDVTILKDILRTYEAGQTEHTVHLVCTPSRLKEEPLNRDEGLRRRNAASQRVNEPVAAEFSQNANIQNVYANYFNRQGANQQYPNIYHPAMSQMPQTGDPNALTNQMSAMQQAYAQYMQQYASMWQAAIASNPALANNWMSAYATVNNVAYPNPWIPTNGQMPNAHYTHAMPANPAPQAQPPPPNDRVANIADEFADDQNGIDWLEAIYNASSIMVFVSLIYFYSSPLRFALVLLLGFVMYLYEIGFFRNMNPQNDRAMDINMNENRQNPQQPVVAERRREAEPEVVAESREAEPETPPQRQETAENGPQQSVFAVTWMIVTSFLTSLIPEGNNGI